MHFIPDGAPIALLCAHPDDEISCGGLIHKLAEHGHPIYYYYFSNCAESTQALGFGADTLIDECYESCKKLGIPKSHVHGFDIPVRHFPQHRQSILESLVTIRKQLDPRLVLVASRDDIHQDHATLTQEAIRAFKNTNLIGYEFPWNHIESHLDFLVKLEERHIRAKIDAWSAYKSQMSRPYHGEKVLESLARVRGVQANSEFAESYEVIRICL